MLLIETYHVLILVFFLFFLLLLFRSSGGGGLAGSRGSGNSECIGVSQVFLGLEKRSSQHGKQKLNVAVEYQKKWKQHVSR